MDRETASIALVLVTVLAVFAAIQPILPANSEPFSELGVLGPGQQIGGYPTSVVAGSPLHLYGYVGNHEGVSTYYQLLVKVGNQTTQVSNSTYAQAPIIFTYSQVLENNQTITFPLTLTLGNPGTDVRLIFELWSYNVNSASFGYTGLWNQLLLNVTSH
jgi:uncharacterized membrane protein